MERDRAKDWMRRRRGGSYRTCNMTLIWRLRPERSWPARSACPQDLVEALEKWLREAFLRLPQPLARDGSPLKAEGNSFQKLLKH